MSGAPVKAVDAAVDTSDLEAALEDSGLQCFGWQIENCPGEVAYTISCPKGDATEYLCAPCLAQIRARIARKVFFGLLSLRLIFRKSCNHAVRLEDCVIRPI